MLFERGSTRTFDVMKAGKRALIAAVVIATGWGLMVVAYDRSQWFFQTSGVVGVLLGRWGRCFSGGFVSCAPELPSANIASRTSERRGCVRSCLSAMASNSSLESRRSTSAAQLKR